MEMKLLSVEPTPSPNTMKLNLDERVDRARTFDARSKEAAPHYIRRLLEIEGVKSVFQTADFIALDRFPQADWRAILALVREVFGDESGRNGERSAAAEGPSFGEVRLYVQVFRHIPMQIRVRTELEEVRESLPERFVRAAMEAGMASPNLIRERKLEDWGVRYGEPAEIAREVIQEIDAAYSDERLKALVERAVRSAPEEEVPEEWRVLDDEQIAEAMNHPDWRVRYRAFGQLRPTERHLPLIARALEDEHASIRRLAVVYLGDVRTKEALDMLTDALKDRSPAVRRTAGDTLSDWGEPAAMGAMAAALKDENKLVRWRAARFLYEVGDESVLEALEEASRDPEFEVALQARMALERIRGGKEAEGAVWQQMARAREKDG
mgnify:FL=1